MYDHRNSIKISVPWLLYPKYINNKQFPKYTLIGLNKIIIFLISARNIVMITLKSIIIIAEVATCGC